MAAALIGPAIGLTSLLLGGGQLTGSSHDNVELSINMGNTKGWFRVDFEAEGCVDSADVGTTTWNDCLDPYSGSTEDEDISCSQFLHRIRIKPGTLGEGDEMSLLKVSAKMGTTIATATTPLTFHPERICAVCDELACTSANNYQMQMFFGGTKIWADELTGPGKTGQREFHLPHSRHLVLHTGTWSATEATYKQTSGNGNYECQKQYENMLVELQAQSGVTEKNCKWPDLQSTNKPFSGVSEEEPSTLVLKKRAFHRGQRLVTILERRAVDLATNVTTNLFFRVPLPDAHQNRTGSLHTLRRHLQVSDLLADCETCQEILQSYGNVTELYTHSAIVQVDGST